MLEDVDGVRRSVPRRVVAAVSSGGVLRRLVQLCTAGGGAGREVAARGSALSRLGLLVVSLWLRRRRWLWRCGQRRSFAARLAKLLGFTLGEEKIQAKALPRPSGRCR